MNFLQRIKILPLLVIVATLCFALRVSEVYVGLSAHGVAFAQEEVDETPPPLPASAADEQSASDSPEESDEIAASKAGSADEAGAVGVPPLPSSGEPVNWQDASESEFDYSEVRSGLYEDLVSRREELEDRERRLSTREALLEATERELDQKLREMTAVRDEIKALLVEQSEQEVERLNSLVRIYEGMKAKDAARIFNTLDMDVLIAVMSRMSERKSGPILAEMSAERARSVTILMAQQKQIPSIPPQ
jgi:flagellar motility protein MotE (MotC chaperone)